MKQRVRVVTVEWLVELPNPKLSWESIVFGLGVIPIRKCKPWLTRVRTENPLEVVSVGAVPGEEICRGLTEVRTLVPVFLLINSDQIGILSRFVLDQPYRDA